MKTLARELAVLFGTLCSAAVYALLIVTFGVQAARVEGFSMAPTLEDHDRLIVNKFVYLVGAPRRGDIVMLRYPMEPDTMYVKRVIAGPGDEVELEDGQVFVNRVPVRDDYVADNYRSHDNFGPVRVQPGYYFVLGDHRNDSADSRVFGQVPQKYILGKVNARWWPPTDAALFH